MLSKLSVVGVAVAKQLQQIEQVTHEPPMQHTSPLLHPGYGPSDLSVQDRSQFSQAGSQPNEQPDELELDDEALVQQQR